MKTKIQIRWICLLIGMGTYFGMLANGNDNYKLYNTWTPNYASQIHQFDYMLCIHEGQLSLNEFGKTKITPASIMIGPIGNPLDFQIKIVGTNTDTVTCNQVGQKIKVQVKQLSTGNYCWSVLLIEDKLAPSILCRDTTVLCTGDLHSLDSFVIIGDNCTPKSQIRVTSSETVKLRECTDDTFSVVTRIWMAFDPWNRVGKCTQVIKLLRPVLAQVVFPKDTTIYCPVSDISPSKLGQPTLNGKALDKFCGWNVNHKDNVFTKCGNSRKIIREWTILDCCNLSDTVVSQFILVLDTAKPIIQCPLSDTISTADNLCYAKFKLPNLVSGFDSCSGTDLSIWIKIDGLKLGVPGQYVHLEPGPHILMYEVSDPCGNKSTCSTTITVLDLQAPVLLCPEIIIIQLPTESITLAATSFSSVSSHDNCGISQLTIRKTNDNCVDGIDDTFFKDSIRICCDEVNEDIEFVFKATDGSMNSDSCTVTVQVVDKLNPELNCTQNDTITCANARPDWIDPEMSLVDNCKSLVKIDIDTTNNVFNLCGLGNITRRVIAEDPAGNKDTCYQSITVIQDSVLKANDIFLRPEEDTLKIIGCNINLLNKDSIGYKPPFLEFNTGACNRIFINYVDTSILAIGTSRCRITNRTWRVGDSCVSLTPLKIIKQIIIQDTTAFLVSDQNIPGRIYTIDAKPIEQVHIVGNSKDQKIIYDEMTDGSGAFMAKNKSQIALLKLDKQITEPLDGISTLDLLRIQQHIVGAKPFESNIDALAADIDENGDINILDIIALKKLILGIHADYSKLTWQFIEDNEYRHRLDPGTKIENVIRNFEHRNKIQIIGFRKGDVTHDVSTNAIISLESRGQVATELRVVENDEGLEIALPDIPVKAMQFSIYRNEGWDDIIDITNQNKSIQYNIIGKELRVLYVESTTAILNSVSKILSIKGAHPKTVLVNGNLSSEWYTDASQPNSLKIVFSKTNKLMQSASIYPVPTQDILNVNIPSRNGHKVTWNIIDQTGRILLNGKTQEVDTKIQVSSLAEGFYILNLEGSNGWSQRHKFLKK